MRFITRLSLSALTISGLLTLTGCEGKPESTQPAANTAKNAESPEAQQAALREFVGKDQTAPAGSPHGGTPTPPEAMELPAGHPPVARTTGPGPEAAPEGDLKFSAPKDWVSSPPTSNMQAQFKLPRAADDAEDGELVVYFFGPGQGGTVELNIDRWKSMFTGADGSPAAADAAKTETLEVNGLRVTTLDVSGRYTDQMSRGHANATDSDYRMLAAVVEGPGGPWFIKGVGPTATMAAQHDAFMEFIRSMKQ